jgi:hypothetical protein
VALCQARSSTKPLWGFSSSNPYHSQSRAEQHPTGTGKNDNSKMITFFLFPENLTHSSKFPFYY